MRITDCQRQSLVMALVTLVILLIFWGLADDWYNAVLLAEAQGQQTVVDRSVWVFQLGGLIIVGLLTLLTYFITSRQTRLSQTVQTQAEALKERLEQYRNVFETTREALVIRDMETLAIVDANPAYCRLHGLSREALIGQPHMVTTDADTYRTYIDIIRREGRYRWEGQTQRTGGATIYVEALARTIIYGGKTHLLVALRDVTEQVEARHLLERRVARRTRELETLLGMARNLTVTQDLEPLLHHILKQIRPVVNYTRARVFHCPDGTCLNLLIDMGGSSSPPLPQRRQLADYPPHVQVIQSGRPLIIPNVRADTSTAQVWCDSLREQRPTIASWLGVPLMLKGQTLGLVTFGHKQADYYTSRHIDLALAFANHVAIAIENARLYEQAQALASLEERRHLARELHDSVSQALYGIALGTRTARLLLDRDPSRLAEPLDYIMNLAEAGLSEMRTLIFELRPEILEAEGLVAALTKQSEALEARHNLMVVTHLNQEPAIPLTIKEALYRISQEATHNIVKHAKASQVDLSLTQTTDKLILEIKDDGQGFDSQQNFPGHLGLQSMHERAERQGGRFELQSTPGQGTIIRVQMPLGQ